MCLLDVTVGSLGSQLCGMSHLKVSVETHVHLYIHTYVHTYMQSYAHTYLSTVLLCAHKTKLLSTMQQNMNIVKWRWVKGTVKVRLSQCLSIMARWHLGGGVCCWSVSPHILCILNLDSMWRWEVSYMPQLLGAVRIQ